MVSTESTLAASIGPRQAWRLPAFIIIGAAKSGTSSLARYLDRHPSLCRSQEKEPCFFDPNANWDRGWEWYESMFDAAEPGQLCFEASTNYTRYPQVTDVPKAIYATLPNAKLIYILRHPVDRAYSHYVHRYMRELYPGQPITRSFEEHIEVDPMCLDSSNYMLQIEQYLAYFPPESLLLVRFRDLKQDPATVLRRVLRFLEVDDTLEIASPPIRENAASRQTAHTMRARVMAPLREAPVLRQIKRYVPESMKRAVFNALKQSSRGQAIADSVKPKPMCPETRARLISMFRSSNERLAASFGFDISGWDC